MDPHEVKTVCDPPYHGWMECPVPGCECFQSWSVGPIPELAEKKCADPKCNYDMVLDYTRGTADER